MNLGFVTEYNERIVAFAADHGFDCLELQAGPTSALYALAGAGRLAEVVRTCDQRGVRISSLCLAINLLGPGRTGEDAHKHYDWLIAACTELAVDAIATCTGQNPELSLEDNMRALPGAWNAIVDRAAQKNIKIIFENCPHGYPAGMNLAVSPPFWHEIFRALPAPNVGLEYDPSHLVYQFVDYLTPIVEFGSRIFRVHAKDTEIDQVELGRVGTHGRDWWRFRLPGGGVVNWPAFVLKLREIQYAGDVLIEHEDPVFSGARLEEGLLMGQRYLSRLLV